MIKTDFENILPGALAVGTTGGTLGFIPHFSGSFSYSRVLLTAVCDSDNIEADITDISLHCRRLFIRAFDCRAPFAYSVQLGCGMKCADFIGVRCGGRTVRRLVFYDAEGRYMTLTLCGDCGYDPSENRIIIHRGRSALIAARGTPDECAALALEGVKLYGSGGDMRQSPIYRMDERRKNARMTDFTRSSGICGGEAASRVFDAVTVLDALGDTLCDDVLLAAASAYLYTDCNMYDRSRDILLQSAASEFPPARNPGSLREAALLLSVWHYAEVSGDTEFLHTVKPYANRLMLRQSSEAYGGMLRYYGNEAIFRHGVYDAESADCQSGISDALFELSRRGYERMYGESAAAKNAPKERRAFWGVCGHCGEAAYLAVRKYGALCPSCAASGREVSKKTTHSGSIPCHPCEAVLCRAAGIDTVGKDTRGFHMPMTDALALRYAASNEVRRAAYERLMNGERRCTRYGEPVGGIDPVSEAVCAAALVWYMKMAKRCLQNDTAVI